MAKDLPYFRFTPQEWQNGDISLESYELQGFFINICCYYWVQNCSITKAMLEKKFRHDISLLEQLEKANIFHHNKKTDFIKISFLDEQFDILSTKRKLRQEAGSKGGKQKSSNATNLLKQKSSYKDKDKDNITPLPPKGDLTEREKKFLEWFNLEIEKRTGSLGKFKTLTKTDKNNLKKIREAYDDMRDWAHAFNMMYKSEWVQENKMVTVSHFLRNDNFTKYLNQTDPTTQPTKFKAPWD